MTYDEAVDVMAHEAFARATWAGVTDMTWGEFPELSEAAWNDVQERMGSLVPTGPGYRLIAQATDALRGEQ